MIPQWVRRPGTHADGPVAAATPACAGERTVRARYFRNRLVVLSASTLPPVWHVGQYATV